MKKMICQVLFGFPGRDLFNHARGFPFWGKSGKSVHGLCLPYAVLSSCGEDDDGEAESRCVEWPVGVGEPLSVASPVIRMGAHSHFYGWRRPHSFVSECAAVAGCDHRSQRQLQLHGRR